jgi:hypothetical protein
MYLKLSSINNKLIKNNNLYIQINTLFIGYAPHEYEKYDYNHENSHKWHLWLAPFLWLVAYTIGRFGLIVM